MSIKIMHKCFYNVTKCSQESLQKTLRPFYFIQMRKKASQLEDKAVAEKEWQMKGEVTHLDRPINSLVDKEVEFGVAKQPSQLLLLYFY